MALVRSCRFGQWLLLRFTSADTSIPAVTDQLVELDAERKVGRAVARLRSTR